MSFRKVALATASAALALGSLTACGGESNTVTPGVDTPAATTPAPAPEATTPAPEPTTPTPTPTPTVKTSGAFGDTITFPSGVSVTVSKPTVVPAAQYASGAVEGKIVVFSMSVINKSKEPVDAVTMGYPRVRYGAKGTEAQDANDLDAGIGAGGLSTILPGETQTIKLGYGIPAAGYSVVRMEVTGPSYSDKPAIFQGAVK